MPARMATRPRSWTSAARRSRVAPPRRSRSAGRRRRELRDTGGVAGEVRRDQIGEVPHRRERTVDPLTREHERRPGLAGDDLVPDRRVPVGREDLVRMVGEAGRDLRVERAAGALADEPRRVRRAAQHALEGGVGGDVHDPHRQRDLLALRAPERPLAVPALREVGEQSRHRRGRPRRRRASPPPRRPPRPPAAASGPSAAARARPGRPGPAPHVRLRQRPQQPEEHLTARSVHDGVEMRRQRAAEDLRRDVRVGGAADVGQQGRVVGLRRRGAVDAEPVAEPHRDQRGLEPVLEREAHPEVGGQAQRCDQLRASHLLAALRRLGRHGTTLLPPRCVSRRGS